jgi:hypothetical protein
MARCQRPERGRGWDPPVEPAVPERGLAWTADCRGGGSGVGACCGSAARARLLVDSHLEARSRRRVIQLTDGAKLDAPTPGSPAGVRSP